MSIEKSWIPCGNWIKWSTYLGGRRWALFRKDGGRGKARLFSLSRIVVQLSSPSSGRWCRWHRHVELVTLWICVTTMTTGGIHCYDLLLLLLLLAPWYQDPQGVRSSPLPNHRVCFLPLALSAPLLQRSALWRRRARHSSAGRRLRVPAFHYRWCWWTRTQGLLLWNLGRDLGCFFGFCQPGIWYKIIGLGERGEGKGKRICFQGVYILPA